MERYSYLTIAKAALANKRLSVTAKVLLALLEDHRNKKTGQCNPRRVKMAEALGVSVETVKRHLTELRLAGLLTSEKGQRANYYAINLGQNGFRQTNPAGSNPPGRQNPAGSNPPGVPGQIRPADAPLSLYEPTLTEPYARAAAAAYVDTPREQQQQQRARAKKTEEKTEEKPPEFPRTAEAMRESFPDVDDAFILRVAKEAVLYAGATNGAPLLEQPTDAVIADAVRHCRRENQTSAGLFLRTVPQCVRTWCTRGRTEALPERKQPATAMDRARILWAQREKERANGRK